MIKYTRADIYSVEDTIKRLMRRQPFGRFLSDNKIDKLCAINFEWNRFIKFSKEGTIIYAINDSSEVIGLIGFYFSKWDTEVFQKRVAFIQYFIVVENNIEADRGISDELLGKFHKWCEENKIDVVITKLDTQYFSPIFVLQQNKYILYETVTIQSLDVTDNNKNEADIIFRFARDSDRVKLKKIALKNTFTKSHFYLDTNFPLDKVEKMYAKWIENALNSRQKIVIVEQCHKIAGVFIYDILDYTSVLNKKIGVWRSAFVDEEFRGKGIGLKLFKATLQSCINDGVDIIDSSLVEKNIISQTFHNKLGFRLINTLYTLHRWID